LVRALGVIPARGGSRRIPRKNLRQLCGKPLIEWTINAAQKANSLTALVVSTEDFEIGKLAADRGVYVVRRPDELAEDDAPSDRVALQALEWMSHSDSTFDILVLLHPTSPLRNSKHIDQAIAALLASSADSLASVEYRKRSYIHNAAIYAVKVPWFLKTKKLYCDSTVPFLMDRRSSLDIDDETDFTIAEALMNGTN
jgi:CMP-N,N'-diacetyllegionaminic acid synthase